MLPKQHPWKSSATLTIMTLTVLLGSSSCSNVFSPAQTSTVATKSPLNVQLLHTLKGHRAWVYAIAIAQNGKYLASGSYDKIIRIWDLPSGQLRYAIHAHEDAIATLAISPDSKILASGSWDNRIKLGITFS
jgi:WD40 repeat protein